MIKKVKVEELRPGMFIHDLNCSWLHHPFIKNSITLRDEDMIGKIAAYGIREVFIDTDRGSDVSTAPEERKPTGDIQVEVAAALQESEGNRDTVSVHEEIFKAKWIIREANRTAQKLMEDIKLGKQMEVEKAEQLVSKMVDSILRNKDALLCLGRIRETDEYTFSHSVNVCALMISFGKNLGLDQPMLKSIGMGGLLHDIGKMKVSADILVKPGPLLEDEMNQIREHVAHGISIVKGYEGIDPVARSIIAQHHERMDGSGYPEGLKGEEISQMGQMAGIVDVYDAITTDRRYKNRVLPTEALKQLYEGSETQFNRELLERFIRCIGIYPIGTLVRLRSGLLGVVIRHSERSLLTPAVRIIYSLKGGNYILRTYDMDLAQNPADSIVGYESPQSIGVVPEMYL